MSPLNLDDDDSNSGEDSAETCFVTTTITQNISHQLNLLPNVLTLSGPANTTKFRFIKDYLEYELQIQSVQANDMEAEDSSN